VNARGALEGCRVLVVEDELAIAMLLESALEDERCVVVGPYSCLRDALVAARNETLDLALLDINLEGEMVFPVAEVLAQRGVPFLILSGYGETALPPNRRHWPVCSKPFKLEQLMSALVGLIRPA
jgi:DNA-binding response OmpR family regulator